MSIITEFERIYGRKPEVVGSAPGRINVIGEHVDYNEGWVLPYAIGYRTSVALARRTDATINLESLQRPGQRVRASAVGLPPDAGRGWAEYVLGTLVTTGAVGGFDILIDGNVPTGAGLSSSAALECATAAAVNLLLDLSLSPQQLALAAQKAENEFVGMPCGIMDQAVSMMSQPAHALLLDCKTLVTEQIPIDLAAAGLALLVIDTQAHHALVDGGYAARRASCEEACTVLGVPSLREVTLAQLEEHRDQLSETQFKRARHAITEIARVHTAVSAMTNGDWQQLGELISASHNSLRDDYTVSCAELDFAVVAAMAVGALGARMVGGGFGGSAIALTPLGLIPAIESAVSDAFSAAGYKSPRFFIATPEAGASAELVD